MFSRKENLIVILTDCKIVHELKLQRDIQFHNNIIKFYGVALFEPEYQNVQSKNYLLVMEYADSGTLKNYLKENFNNFTWNDKYNLAYQLTSAVSCLHNERIVHRDLHSGNVLVHQNTIKLSDFGLSKRIESSSNTKTKFFGCVPYVDPKRFSGRKKNKNSNQICSFNKKSDIYSVGVLFWELSSGQPPFATEEYDIDLALEISQGRREKPILNTPENYIKIYTECWDNEPDNHEQKFNPINIDTSNINNSLHGEMSQIIENFGKMDTKEMVYTSLTNEDISSEKNSNIIVRIETSENRKKAFNLFIKASEQNHILAQYYVGLCYECGRGTVKDKKLAFEYYKKIANKGNVLGLFRCGYFYDIGFGISRVNEIINDMCPRCNSEVEDWYHIWKCERNEVNIDEILYEAIAEYEEILILEERKEDLDILRDININFYEIMMQKSDILIGYNRIWELLRGTRIWVKRCDDVADIEKNRGIDSKGKRKRKNIIEEGDSVDNKKLRKIQKTKENSLNEKNTENLVKLVTRDSLLDDVINGRSFKNTWER
ncbi:hypothetical protein RIR_jg12115.t1 [Rhizophagus irregularis DAOM 181602=DAOM 197198]|nr:hypothetical protein RIR_jg12115.t1 [Rhizophagus irregularis DAOM 181602=DAOM 197198]